MACLRHRWQRWRQRLGAHQGRGAEPRGECGAGVFHRAEADGAEDFPVNCDWLRMPSCGGGSAPPCARVALPAKGWTLPQPPPQDQKFICRRSSSAARASVRASSSLSQSMHSHSRRSSSSVISDGGLGLSIPGKRFGGDGVQPAQRAQHPLGELTAGPKRGCCDARRIGAVAEAFNGER